MILYFLFPQEVYKALLEKAKKFQKINDDEWEEINAKAAQNHVSLGVSVCDYFVLFIVIIVFCTTVLK